MKTYIIAEIGVNHNGSFETAMQLIEKAADARVDAVKFQIFRPELLAHKFTPMVEYQTQNTGVVESQIEMLNRLTLTNDKHLELKRFSEHLNLDYLASPFDHSSLDFLVSTLQVKCIKIASGEITNAPMLLKAAQSHLKIIMSTGMATIDEIRTALGVCAYGYLNPDKPNINSNEFKSVYQSKEGQDALQNNITLLQCTTAYPCPLENVNLNAMDTLATTFRLPIGFSDHTMGINVALAAVAKNAVLIEKHFTLDRSQVGPDHAASLEPHELKKLVEGIREIELALGNGVKSPTLIEKNNKTVVRKHIIATKNIDKCEKFTYENIACKRIANGLDPIKYWDLLNNTAGRKYLSGEAIEL